MTPRPLFRIGGLAACAIFVAQIVLSSLAHAAAPMDARGLLCAPSGAPSAEALDAARALAALLHQNEDGGGFCPLCQTPSTAAAPTPGALILVRVSARADAPRPCEFRVVAVPRGPPLGLRAPPLLGTT